MTIAPIMDRLPFLRELWPFGRMASRSYEKAPVIGFNILHSVWIHPSATTGWPVSPAKARRDEYHEPATRRAALEQTHNNPPT